MNRVFVILMIMGLSVVTTGESAELAGASHKVDEEGRMKEKILIILDQLKAFPNNQAVLDQLDWLTFYIALVPIPAVQQAAQVANKMVSDQELKVQFDEIKSEILKLNGRIDVQDEGLGRIDAIARTVDSSEALEKKIEEFVRRVIGEIEKENTEFVVDTSNWSVQVLVKQIIDANIVQIRAENHSQNVIRGTKISAKKTRLEAYDHSMNYFDGTNIQGDDGRVDMQGVGQTGDVRVEGASVSIHGNGSLIIGARPETVSVNCPFCGYHFTFEKFGIQEGVALECPACQKRLTVKF